MRNDCAEYACESLELGPASLRDEQPSDCQIGTEEDSPSANRQLTHRE